MLGRVKINNAIVNQMAKKVKEQEKKAEVADTIAPFREVDKELPNAIVMDIDRTLAIRNPYRGIFEFDKALDDDIVGAIQWLNKATGMGATQMILITGREEKFRSVCEAWIKKHGLACDKLLMRQTGDFRKADITKEELWVAHIAHKYNVIFWLDDDPTIKKMCQRLGIYFLLSDNSRW